ncbi:MAG: Ig-like domain-containing protein [bacterium]
MPRWVPCAECGNRYDADTTAFCPRCGSTIRGKDPEVRVPVLANDPRRRRAQMGGAILLFMGLAFFGLWGYGLASAGFHPEGSIDSFVGLTGDSPIPAGDLHLQILDNGTAVPNATVALALPSGVAFKSGITDDNGWFNVTLDRQAAVNITVHAGNITLERRAFVVWPASEEVHLDVADPARSTAWLGLQEFNQMALVVLMVSGVAFLLMAVGGGAALALRTPNLAVAAPMPTVVLTGLLFLWTLLVGVFYVGIVLLLALQVTAIVMVASGRSAFRKRR